VQSLEGSSAGAGLGSSAGGEDLGSLLSRGTWDSLSHARSPPHTPHTHTSADKHTRVWSPAGFATMRKPAPGASTTPDPNFPKGPFNKRNSVLHHS
jgi:hypothetical protein